LNTFILSLLIALESNWGGFAIGSSFPKGLGFTATFGISTVAFAIAGLLSKIFEL
jgi:hypothetical protein